MLGVERHPADPPRSGPGACRLRGDVHPPTGRWCIAGLGALGGADLELRGCYRVDGDSFVLDHATVDKDEAEVVFEFDGTECWIVGKETWASTAGPIKAFLARTTGCARVRDDYEF